MNIETAQKVSELLKKKIEFEKDLSELLSENNIFKIGYKMKGIWLISNIFQLNSNLSEEFYSKMKNLVIEELQNSINQIDKEIESLKC